LGDDKPKIENTTKVYGGSINRSFKVQSGQQNYFVKLNSRSLYPQMFELEAEGLELLSSSKAIKIPRYLTHGVEGDTAFLVLEFIESSSESANFWEDYGRQLATLHQQSAENFGLSKDNYIGSLKQINTPKSNWTDFFIENRLQEQLKMAVDSKLVDGALLKKFDQLFKQMPNYFPEEKPSLLHGVLWAGNFMVGAKGEPVIMDPAVYYGHREMDIAMSHLFGGFHARFYKAYNEAFPLETKWEERIELCNLYPLLVHVNLFGGDYLSRVKNSLNRLI
jgi:fructosamine-3-kinase